MRARASLSFKLDFDSHDNRHRLRYFNLEPEHLLPEIGIVIVLLVFLQSKYYYYSLSVLSYLFHCTHLILQWEKMMQVKSKLIEKNNFKN